MRKTIGFICISIISAGIINAKEWNISGIIGANYSETAVSDNWGGGETDARSWAIKGEGAAEKDLEKTNWLNSLKLEFGKASLGTAPEEENADLIDFDSVYSYKLSDYINPYLAFTADSQFTEFFDPSLLSESAGIGWLLITQEEQNLKTRLGGALRQTIVEGVYADREAGAESITNYDLKLNEYVKLVSELKMFSSFDAIVDTRWDASVDTRWDTSLYIKLGKYLTAQIGYLIVNSGVSGMDMSDTVQTRFTFGLGFSYNLF